MIILLIIECGCENRKLKCGSSADEISAPTESGNFNFFDFLSFSSLLSGDTASKCFPVLDGYFFNLIPAEP